MKSDLKYFDTFLKFLWKFDLKKAFIYTFTQIYRAVEVLIMGNINEFFFLLKLLIQKEVMKIYFFQLSLIDVGVKS